MENWYLVGYKEAIATIKHDLQKYGWARAKGYVKNYISWKGYKESNYPLCDYSKGYLDALLDSVN